MMGCVISAAELQAKRMRSFSSLKALSVFHIVERLTASWVCFVKVRLRRIYSAFKKVRYAYTQCGIGGDGVRRLRRKPADRGLR